MIYSSPALSIKKYIYTNLNPIVVQVPCIILSIEITNNEILILFSHSVFSENDHSYIKLAAGKSVLQLATRWDSHISPELFRNTLLIARVLAIFYTANCYLVFRFHTEVTFLFINLPKLFTYMFFGY